ncbi:MAG: DUF4159 domain-containing protein [Chthoniobacterales bacterium]|jgi:hypothetical protein
MEGQPDPQNQPERKKSMLDRLIEKFSESRFFTISFVLHVLLIAIFGGTVLFEAMQEPSDFEGGEGGFVAAGEESAAPPPSQTQPQETTFTVSTPTVQNTTVAAITTTGQNPLNFSMDAIVTPSTMVKPTTAAAAAPVTPSSVGAAGMSAQVAAGIRGFTGGWGKGSGSGTGVRQREFNFTAFVAQYGDPRSSGWNSVYRFSKDNNIPTGALPNLLEFMSKASRDKIKTDYKNVQAIKLDSDEIFVAKPPFIFFTGSRDFTLTDKEVENLQKYIRLGGAIWGDSSVPGRGSRFDIAFRREMKRIIPDKDKDFEDLESNDPVFRRLPYYTEIKEQPPGINYYQEPVRVMRYFGEVAIIYTANDYGDMWQFGVKEEGRDWVINTDKDEARGGFNGPLVAQDEQIYWLAQLFLHNVDPNDVKKKDGILDSYKFGTNMIIHLLTRWEDKLRSAPRL